MADINVPSYKGRSLPSPDKAVNLSYIRSRKVQKSTIDIPRPRKRISSFYGAPKTRPYSPRTSRPKAKVASVSYPQGCIAKISYSKGVLKASTDSSAVNMSRLNYISRSEATMDETMPAYENASRQSRVYTYIDGSKVMCTNQIAMNILGNNNVFRIILTPQNPHVDLSELTSRFLQHSFFKAIGSDNVHWFAANHYNTDHPHSHILVSRNDNKSGRELAYPKSYITSQRANSEASEILTEMIGPLSEVDVAKLRKKPRSGQVQTKSLTTLDYDIDALSISSRQGRVLSYDSIYAMDKATGDTIRRRLLYLARSYPETVQYDREKRAFIMQDNWLLRLDVKSAKRRFGLMDSDRVILDDRQSSYRGTVQNVYISEDDRDEDRTTLLLKDEKGSLHIISRPIVDFTSPQEAREALIGKSIEIDEDIDKTLEQSLMQFDRLDEKEKKHE